jgi:hypothetical protein
MTAVEGTHCRDEGERAVVEKLLFAPLPQWSDFTEDLDFRVWDSRDACFVVLGRGDGE